MKKSLIILFLIVYSINVSSQETQWYAIIGYTTNTYLEGFDCNTDKIHRILLSTPTAIPLPDELVKHNLRFQFLDWAYDNEKEILDKVAKHTKTGWGAIYYGRSKEEVIKKATKAGLFSSETGECDGHININKVNGFNFREGDLNATIGGDKRKKFLESYLNHQ